MAKRPRDPNQLAKQIVDIATGEAEDTVSPQKRNPLPRGRAGGLKGGRIHKTLRITPAMAAGISDHVWSLDEITLLTD